MLRYLLLRLTGWRPAVAENPVVDEWICGPMAAPVVHGGPWCQCDQDELPAQHRCRCDLVYPVPDRPVNKRLISTIDKGQK